MIPMSKDVADLLGPFASGIENRSLLHEKFALPKNAPGFERKLDHASRWNVLRIGADGTALLASDAKDNRDAYRRRQKPEDMRNAEVAEGMAASVPKKIDELADAAARNARQLLEQVRASYGGRGVVFEAELGGRLLVNLAGGVVENAGISLDRCFGLPYIPGSAVKGIVRSYALWLIREAADAEKPELLENAMRIFGYVGQDWDKEDGAFAWAGGMNLAKDTAAKIGAKAKDRRGCVCFLPAHPTKPPKIVVDMVNPHYKDYYGGRAQKAEDTESPVPNYFPAVKKGATYGFSAVLMRPPSDGRDLLLRLEEWMKAAVSERGIGAKTAAGYGWFWRPGQAKPVVKGAPAVITNAAGVAVALPPELEKYGPTALSNPANFRVSIPALQSIQDDAQMKKAFDLLVPDQERRRLQRNNRYWQSFTSGKHGEDGKKILKRLGLELK